MVWDRISAYGNHASRSHLLSGLARRVRDRSAASGETKDRACDLRERQGVRLTGRSYASCNPAAHVRYAKPAAGCTPAQPPLGAQPLHLHPPRLGRLAHHRHTRKPLRQRLPDRAVQRLTQPERLHPYGLTRDHPDIVIDHRDRLLVFGQVDPDHRTITRQQPAQPLPPGVPLPSPVSCRCRYPYPQNFLLAAFGTLSPYYRTRRTFLYQPNPCWTTASSALSYYYAGALMLSVIGVIDPVADPFAIHLGLFGLRSPMLDRTPASRKASTGLASKLPQTEYRCP